MNMMKINFTYPIQIYYSQYAQLIRPTSWISRTCMKQQGDFFFYSVLNKNFDVHFQSCSTLFQFARVLWYLWAPIALTQISECPAKN